MALALPWFGATLGTALGLGDVAFNAGGLLVKVAEPVLRRGEAEVGRMLVPGRRLRHVDLQPRPSA